MVTTQLWKPNKIWTLLPLPPAFKVLLHGSALLCRRGLLCGIHFIVVFARQLLSHSRVLIQADKAFCGNNKGGEEKSSVSICSYRKVKCFLMLFFPLKKKQTLFSTLLLQKEEPSDLSSRRWFLRLSPSTASRSADHSPCHLFLRFLTSSFSLTAKQTHMKLEKQTKITTEIYTKTFWGKKKLSLTLNSWLLVLPELRDSWSRKWEGKRGIAHAVTNYLFLQGYM